MMMLFISQNPVTIKSYMLRSGNTEQKPILLIPDEFDENLTAEIEQASNSAKPNKSSKPAKSASSPSEPEKVSNTKPNKSSKPAKSASSASSPSETETVSVKSKRVSRNKKVVSKTVTSTKPNKVVTRSKRFGSSKSSIVESETVKSVKSIRDSAREEWFDMTRFLTPNVSNTHQR